MTRRVRLLRNAALILGGLLLVGGIVVFQTIQTDWFRNYVSAQIVTATEDAVGGKVEVGAIQFDWRHLQASVDNFIIHGSEPAGSAPFVRVPHVVVDLRLFSSFRRIISVSFLGLEQPEVNVLIASDGSTNVPTPPHKQPADNTSPLETLVNLAIGRFEVKSGVIHYNSRVEPLDVRGTNLQVQLAYHVLKQDYAGRVSFQMLYTGGINTSPLAVSLNIPFTLERDRIAVQDATISTALSELKIEGSVENLRDPKTSAHVLGHVSLIDVNSLSNLGLGADPTGKLSDLILDANADVSGDTISVKNLHIALGGSTVDAKGTLKDPKNQGAVDFSSSLNLAELATRFKTSEKLSGVVLLDGKAQFAGNLIRIQPFRLRAFGGEVEGDASLEDFARYQITARLKSFDLQSVEQRLGITPLPYSGSVAGTIEARGDLRSTKPTDMEASAALNIAPGRAGIPVSGRINASYSAATGDLRANQSNLRLPHTAVQFQGSVREGLRVNLTSQDLHDLFAAVPSLAQTSPVTLNGGQVQMQAVVSGSLADPIVKGHLTATRFVVEDRRFDSLAADIDARRSRIAVAGGILSRGGMQARFAGSAGLAGWSPEPRQPLAITATIANGDLADVIALAGQKSSGYSGVLTADVNISGTFGDPLGSANVQIVKGVAAGEPFDQAQFQIALTDQHVSMPAGYILRDSTRLNLSAEYTHPPDSFTTGHLTAHVSGSPVDLAQIRSLQSKYPNVAGTLQVDATLAGDAVTKAGTSEFELTEIAGDFAARAIRFDGSDYGSINAKLSTAAKTVTYNLTSDFAGSQIRADGRTQLGPDYPTNLDATLSNLPIERILAVAKRADIPAKGILAGTVHFSGTVKDPQGNVDLNLSNAVLYDEPVDRLQLRADYLPKAIDITRLQVDAGPSQISLTARFDHPAMDLDQGDLQFKIDTGRIDLARVRNVQQRRQGLAGTLQVAGAGKAQVRPQAAADTARIVLEELNAQLSATGLAAQNKNLGNLNLTANTAAGRLNFTLNSTLANSSIQGRGDAQLSGDYPVNADLTFSGLSWSNLQPLIGTGDAGAFDGNAAGNITVKGPLAKLDQLTASARLTTLQIRPVQARNAGGQPIVLQNQGDVALSLENGRVRIDNAHFTGPQTDITASGTASVRDQSLDLKVDANANLALLQSMTADMFSSGSVALTGTVQGTMSTPRVNGRLELHSASVSYAGLPMGISNANGVVGFNGNSATIQSFTADSGGGRLTLSGFATQEDQLRFAVRAVATGVRVRIQQGVSIVATANINLTGTADSSLASGSVNVDRVTYLPQTDIASILTRSAPPVQAPSASSSVLANMKLDISLRTSSATSVQTSASENLQVFTDLRVRGTAAQPGVSGTMQLGQGKLVFFGSSYTINTGTISFYNLNRIEPILNLSLQTQAQGVTVTLSVTGPVDNMKLSYTSDPPLRFEEIVALLAAGSSPTSDPTLLANQPSQPPQNFQERGESAILSKALADPVSSRLKRVFGVSELKIDPSFTSGSALPQARVTLQQQVSTNVVFTYVTALDGANTQEIRIEWALTPQWSAIANRDENGLFSVNLQYKKDFR